MNRRALGILVFAAVAIGRIPVCKANGDPGFVPSFSLNTSSSSIKGQYPSNNLTRIRMAPDNATGDFILPINLKNPQLVMPIAGSSTFQYALASLTLTDSLGNAPFAVDLSKLPTLPATLDLGSSGKAANRSITITATATYSAQVIPDYVKAAQTKAATDAAAYTAAATASQADPTNSLKAATANTLKAIADASQKAATAALALAPNPLLYPDIPEQTSIVIYIDTTPPIVDSVVVNPLPGAGGTIVITLRDSDLDQTTIAQGDFDVEMLVGTTTTAATVGPTTNAGAPTPNLNQQVPIAAVGVPTYDPAARAITLNYNQLAAGNYSITVSKLADRVGNVITATQGDPTNPRTFNVTAGRIHGKQIEYPEFLTPEDRRGTFDPADKVETRRVNLYYFRDAHRVAEIINRNTQHLNQTGYDATQRIAQDARTAADNKTLERRTDEFQAVEAARNTRATRKQYQDTLQQLTAAQQQNTQLQNQNTEIQNAANSVAPPPGSSASATTDIAAKLAAYQAAVTDNEQQTQALQQSATPLTAAQSQQLAALQAARPGLVTSTNLLSSLQIQQQQNTATTAAVASTVTQLTAAADQLRTTLNEAQKSDVNTRLTLQQAEQQETLLKSEQFRREVAAGLTDLDTYAAGKLTSIDPVTQVTITVVGEGVIELRGPVKGINKICRIIHDIDTPVGQVKVGIHTVQVNGEHGDRMELVYEQIEKHIAHSRFLSNQAGQLIRKAAAQVATAVAAQVDQGGMQELPSMIGGDCRQLSEHEMKYLYAFFGRDFVNELKRMDSELLSYQNKLMSLNSMDSMSLAGALYVTALADNPIRLAILERFRELVATELPELELEYYRALTHTRCADPHLNKIAQRNQWRYDRRDAKSLLANASRTYTFPNFLSFFDSQYSPAPVAVNGVPLQTDGAHALNGVQYATLRMAQALKAQLAEEMTLRNMVLERSLLEKTPGEIENDVVTTTADLKKKTQAAKVGLDESSETQREALTAVVQDALKAIPAIQTYVTQANLPAQTQTDVMNAIARLQVEVNSLPKEPYLTPVIDSLRQVVRPYIQQNLYTPLSNTDQAKFASELYDAVANRMYKLGFHSLVDVKTAWPPLSAEVKSKIVEQLQKDAAQLYSVSKIEEGAWRAYQNALTSESEANRLAQRANEKLFSKRLLDQFIDEQEERAVELLEALRAHSSNVDNYLKRLSIALEDDVNAQFYNPAFQDIRRASYTWDVNLGQIETTTILTNNRCFAKVDPAASFEFDLPKRELLITEAMRGAKALTTEYGNLMQDGTFLAATSLLAGQPAAGIMGSQNPVKMIPGLPAGGAAKPFGAALDELIPDPAIYKFETGTGFEIRPVIQPDGHSIIYNFDYMYTTNIREPVEADEKHLGRVKRHYVHTDVQTSSFELREVSRYMVALKASRTGRGVPLLEDIPAAGWLFRPLPNAESSLQMNIILASSVIYPTMYDLMGLRWAPYAEEINYSRLNQEKKATRQRWDDIRERLLQRTRKTVNERIGLPNRSMISEDTSTNSVPPSWESGPPQMQPPMQQLPAEGPPPGEPETFRSWPPASTPPGPPSSQQKVEFRPVGPAPRSAPSNAPVTPKEGARSTPAPPTGLYRIDELPRQPQAPELPGPARDPNQSSLFRPNNVPTVNGSGLGSDDTGRVRLTSMPKTSKVKVRVHSW